MNFGGKKKRKKKKITLHQKALAPNKLHHKYLLLERVHDATKKEKKKFRTSEFPIIVIVGNTRLLEGDEYLE